MVVRCGVGFAGRHHEALSQHLALRGGDLVEGLVVAQRGIADARQLVGQGAGGLVVIAARLKLHSPLPQRRQRLAFVDGRPQHTACAVGEQHAKVSVALLRDTLRVPGARKFSHERHPIPHAL